jgi:MerR family transcriptional regulator, light-induced transcriptional regulator
MGSSGSQGWSVGWTAPSNRTRRFKGFSKMSQSPQRKPLLDSSAGNRPSLTLVECEDEPLIGAIASEADPIERSTVSESQMGWLVSTIENDIIPRLLNAHRARHQRPAVLAAIPAKLDSYWVEKLAQIILVNDAGAASAFVESIRAKGIALETIYLDLLAPAARHLGELWNNDETDFTQVTIGLWRLQQLMYEFSPAFQDDTEHGTKLRRTMLVPVPGSQHTLGLLMVAEFFRRAGWVVWGDPTASVSDLLHAARTQWFDMIGFSVGTQTQFGALTDAISAIREASQNPDITVMVGGPVFVANPELVELVGADATAADASKAVDYAETLIADRKHRA